jgi:hypothetical protein
LVYFSRFGMFTKKNLATPVVLFSMRPCKKEQRLPKPFFKALKFVQSWLARTGGRCYYHNFWRFLPIFAKNIVIFLKNQGFDPIFAKNLQ